jgi:hypothetical protein
LAETGQFFVAGEAAERGAMIALQLGDTTLSDAIQRRRTRYLQNQPYREPESPSPAIPSPSTVLH